MSDFVFKKRNYAVILGILMLISACSEKSDDESVNSSSSFNYAIDDKLHTEQVVIMLFDIHIGTDGRVLDVHLSEGQVDQGVFTQAAIRKIKQTEFAVRKVDGVAQPYWQRNQPIQAGSVALLDN